MGAEYTTTTKSTTKSDILESFEKALDGFLKNSSLFESGYLNIQSEWWLSITYGNAEVLK